MKTKILNIWGQFLLAASIMVSSCSLEEYNPNTTSIDLAYETQAGYEGLLDYCYDGLYYFYGKIDGIGIMEMGTDLWFSEDKEKGFAQYGSEMTTELGTLKVFWQGMYATINYCNTAIYFINGVEDYSEDEKNKKVAEAYFLRAWCNLHLVEQFGGVVLREEPSFITGPDISPVRSSEAEFYDLIISDLKFACQHLPLSQGEDRGRVAKKAGYGMLAKAYLQRTRLNEPEASDYARLSLEAAKELIDNPDKYYCSLYTSEDSLSGYAKLWDGENNKANTEFLFLEAVDHETFFNPEGSNRGRTRQYYLMDLRNVGSEWGTSERNCYWYGRANDRGFKPSKYLLTEVFEPVKDPADTRFDNTFFSEYYNASGNNTQIGGLVYKYNKDEALGFHQIKNTLGTINTSDEYYGGKNYYGGITASGVENMVDLDGDGFLDGLSVFTPNYTYTAEEKRVMPFLCVDPSDMFDENGKWVTAATSDLGAYFAECYPSFNKFSSLYWIYSNQHWMGDVPILRLGEVYLIAAEAALRYNNDQATAATYVNAIRQRAAIAQRAAEMTVANGEITLDFILEERARELAGEQVRWVDLKRFGKLSNAYLSAKNPDIISFDDDKNKVRPIPQSYLDAITNPGEFGTNGY